MSAFDDWLESLDLRPEENVTLNMAYIAGRAYQREEDAKIAETIDSVPFVELRETIAQTIREQKIDD